MIVPRVCTVCIFTEGHDFCFVMLNLCAKSLNLVLRVSQVQVCLNVAFVFVQNKYMHIHMDMNRVWLEQLKLCVPCSD